MSAKDDAWWLGCKYRIYLDFHMTDRVDQGSRAEPAFRDLDVESLVAQVRDTDADALVFYAKDNRGNSYYPTDVGHHLSDLAGRDVVGEFVEALRGRSMRAIAYFQPIRDHRAFDAHPEWRQVNNDGSYRIWNGHKLVCPLGPAGVAALDQLAELAARYEIDGVWFDRVGDVGGSAELFGCFCDSCLGQFRDHAGEEIPRVADWADPVWRAYWRWRSDALCRFQQRARDVLHAHRPDAAMIGNYASYGMALVDPFPQSADMEAIADATDVVAFECQHFRSYLHASSHPAFIDALTDHPADLLVYNMLVIGDGVIRSRPAIEAMTHSVLARGHAVTLLDSVVPFGQVDPRFVDNARAIFARGRRMDEAMAGSRPLKYAAILFSPRTFTEYGRGRPDEYVEEFMGMLRLLVEAHVPMEVISDRHLTAEQLREYAVLVAPDAACLTDEAEEAIRGWVQEEGGVLLASHETSRRTPHGEPRDEFGLADVLGVTYEGAAELPGHWMKAVPGPLADAGWGDAPVPLRTGAALVKVLPGTEVLAHVGTPHPSPGGPPSKQWGPYPAATVRRAGSGVAVYVAGCLGRAALELGVPELAGPLEAVIRLAPAPPARVSGPASLEMICRRRSDGGWLLHLVNMPGEASRTHRMANLGRRTTGVREIWPLADVTIQIDRRVRAARELLDGLPLRVEQTQAGSRIHLERLPATAALALDF